MKSAKLGLLSLKLVRAVPMSAINFLAFPSRAFTKAGTAPERRDMRAATTHQQRAHEA